MIAELNKANSKVLNLILYVDNDALQYYARNLLKKKFDCVGDAVLDVSTAKELNKAQKGILSYPLEGSAWMINVNTDKMSKKDLEKALYITPNATITVYWVSKYSLYKDLLNLDIVKKQGVFCYTNYFGRLTANDIVTILDTDMKTQGFQTLNNDLLNFIVKNYQWDVQAVFDMVAYLKSGNEFETTKDVIEAIGLGGNTVDSFLVNLLLTNVNTLKGKKTAIRKQLKALNDLSYSYSYSTIRNFMLNTLRGFIEMKQLQLRGSYRRGHCRVPEGYNEKRLAKLRRYEWAVLERFTLARLFLLENYLEDRSIYNIEMRLVNAIIGFIDDLKDTREEELATQILVGSASKKRKSAGVLYKKHEVRKPREVIEEPKSEATKDSVVSIGALRSFLFDSNSTIDDFANEIANSKVNSVKGD